MFNKILVANRGEIAVRIMRACKECGIKSVAIYSEADRNALFAKYADEAYCIGPPPASQSYLDIEKIISVAEKVNADGIHPGYGFLAENANFARACEESGIQFIGPTSEAILKTGNKVTCRNLMKKVGIPTIPGTKDAIENIDEAYEAVEHIGFPVLVKPCTGGGGKGMRTAYNKEELSEAIEFSKAIAKSTSGDASVFLERYIEKPRHIEFQLLADTKGNIIHLGERECSIQRRHQKLIEEAPSAIVTEEMREEMGSLVVKAAKAADYTNAGTFEFIFADGNFYFLEVNSRLQVEHTVTEMITGVDIVKEQLKIASGERMSYSQEDININGWAIECRINAEDPLTFMPSLGKIDFYRSPGGIGIRVDSGINMGYDIPPFYDSMVSKLIVYGRNREEAINRLNRALYEYIIIGVKTNIPFHKAVINNEFFRSGELSTDFIEEHNITGDVEKILESNISNLREFATIFVNSRCQNAAYSQKTAIISAAIAMYLEEESI